MFTIDVSNCLMFAIDVDYCLMIKKTLFISNIVTQGCKFTKIRTLRFRVRTQNLSNSVRSKMYEYLNIHYGFYKGISAPTIKLYLTITCAKAKHLSNQFHLLLLSQKNLRQIPHKKYFRDDLIDKW